MKAIKKKALDSYDIIKKEIVNTITNYDLNDTNSKKNKKDKIIKKSSIIFKNLKKYSITKKVYDIFIINSIIFDQKMHIVSTFKNYLLWDETSEFLKRFYNKAESLERIPNISQYYQSYTLFAPVYFGLSPSIALIMNEWTKNKKAYLEYLEDKEDEDNEKKKYNLQDLNFKKLIDTELLLNSESSNSKSQGSKKTIDLTMYDKIDSFFLKDINLSLMDKDKQEIDNKVKNKNSSLSKIMEDLSSHYSIYIANSYKPKVSEENKFSKNNNNSKSRKIESKKEIKKNNKNIVLSDKILFSFTNLYKKRNKKKKKFHAGTCNNSSSKVKRSQIYEKNNQDKKSKDKIIPKNKININKNLSNILKKKINSQINNLKNRINNFTRNKSILKEKKENNKRYTLTNVNNSCNNNSINNSYFKFKIKKNKFRKLFLRNIKINTSSYTHYRNSNNNNNSLNMNNTSQNKNEKSNDKIYKCNLTKLLTSKDGKSKNLLNGNIVNLKNINNYYYIKQKNKMVNNLFYYKNYKLIKEKRTITSRNSFSNNHHNLNKSNNSKYKKSLSKSKNNTNNKFNKKLSGNLKNTVLTQFHLKHDKTKKNLISSFIVSRNNSLLKNKKKTFTGRSSKRLNDSLSIKPYKKELNKINFNFNFNINFNIDINKNRQKKYLLAYKNKNNFGYFTQRNPIINNIKLNKSKNKIRGDNSHRKNNVNHIFMKKK